jgi:uncharacterized protein (DUF433 family)
MQLEDYFDFLTPNDIRLKGHRIGIESVLYEYLHNEKTPHEILERFPTLNLEKIYATLLYYHQQQAEIDQYLADWLEFGRRMREEQARNPHPGIVRLRKIKAELEAAKQRDPNLDVPTKIAELRAKYNPANEPTAEPSPQ